MCHADDAPLPLPAVATREVSIPVEEGASMPALLALPDAGEQAPGVLVVAEVSGLATVCSYGFPAGSPSPTPKAPPRPLDVVPRMDGPILGLFGEDDTAVGVDTVRAFEAACREHDVECECIVYPGAGHGFLRDAALDAGSAGTSPAEDAWRRALAFLRSATA